MIACSMPKLSKTYAENMPNWVVAKYFDPEAERHRLLIHDHDYQQTEFQQIRCMKKTKLVDSIELPLKSLDNVLTAVNKVLSSGLDIYLNQFVAPFIGDWPMQFFIRQLVYSNIPTVTPPHTSALVARTCYVLVSWIDNVSSCAGNIYGISSFETCKPNIKHV